MLELFKKTFKQATIQKKCYFVVDSNEHTTMILMILLMINTIIVRKEKELNFNISSYTLKRLNAPGINYARWALEELGLIYAMPALVLTNNIFNRWAFLD